MPLSVNLHIRNAPPFPALAHHLRSLNALPAFACGGSPWSSVFPCVGERSGAGNVEELARELSRSTVTAVAGFLVDAPARFQFWLCDRGTLVASYDSERPTQTLIEAIVPFCASAPSLDDLRALLHDRRTRTLDETALFLREWRQHRKTLREHLLQTYARESHAPSEPDLVSLLREYDHHSDQMNASETKDADAGDLAGDFGRFLGLREETARVGYREALAGGGPLGATVRLD